MKSDLASDISRNIAVRYTFALKIRTASGNSSLTPISPLAFDSDHLDIESTSAESAEKNRS